MAQHLRRSYMVYANSVPGRSLPLEHIAVHMGKFGHSTLHRLVSSRSSMVG